MRFASIGDCCVDVYPHENKLGGTAYNSAVAAKKFGAETSIISALGNDKNGISYKKSLGKKHIDTSHLIQLNGPTSSVHITLDENNSPVFGKWNLGALKDWQLNNLDLAFIKHHDVAKAILLKPLKNYFVKFCQTKMAHTLKAGDFAGDSIYSCSAEMVKDYIDGLDIAIKSLDAKNTYEMTMLQTLAKKKNKIILVTLGEKGSICFAGDKAYKQSTNKIKPINTTGFGDIYIAVFLIEYFQKKDIQNAMCKATEAVVTSV